MIKQKNSDVKEQKRSDLISQECDLVEELSDEDLENVAGGALSNIVLSNIVNGLPPMAHMMYGIAPERLQLINGIIAARLRSF
jgi:hypothetical protein